MYKILKKALVGPINVMQLVLLMLSYRFFNLFSLKKVSWVVGTDEIAGVLRGVAAALPDSYSVNLSIPSLRNSKYNYTISPGPFHEARRLLIGPMLLGFLANKSEQFYYIWNRGFLLSRSSEFKFLKSHGVRLAIMFCGDDIRSPLLHRQICLEKGRDSFVNYGFYLNPPGGPEVYEKVKKATAVEAELYGDVIFNAPVCQSSYLNNESPKLEYAHGFISIDDSQFCHDELKFNDEKLRIIHAPTSMSTKGTPFVREAIHRLNQERSDFEYVELQGTPHHEVIEQLHQSHICLNWFLSFGTGVLGAEAMAARCATLMSADPSLEPSIPSPAFGTTPWLITQSHEIYEHLKQLLDDRNKLKEIATQGFDYALENYSYRASSMRLHESLERHGFDISKFD